MGGASNDGGASFSTVAGGAYTFNLIVGVGALALPVGFQHAGLVLGSVMLLFLAFTAFVTVTFVIEALAVCNALSAADRGAQEPPGNAVVVPAAAAEAPSPYEITERFEMSAMSKRLLGPRKGLLFNVSLVVYLFGDLAIYAVAVPLSLSKFTGSISLFGWNLSDPYTLYVVVFAAVVGPFCFADLSGSKILQYFTLASRNIAFWLMICFALVRIGNGDGARPSGLKEFDLSGFPGLIGTSLYAYMCHHSLPSIVQPIRNKGKLRSILMTTYGGVFLSYTLLCLTALLAFGDETEDSCPSHPGHACKLQSLYTLNFSSLSARPVADFLVLFPVFTLTTNYPIICITLRRNLEALYQAWRLQSQDGSAGSYERLVQTPAGPEDGAGADIVFPPPSGLSPASSTGFLRTHGAVVVPTTAAPLPAGGAGAGADAAVPDDRQEGAGHRRTWKEVLRRNLFALCSWALPITVALGTRHVDDLVSITGSFAGLFIQVRAFVRRAYRRALRVRSANACRRSRTHTTLQYVIPVALVHGAREQQALRLGSPGSKVNSAPLGAGTNPHASPFSHVWWLRAILIWSAVAFGISVYNMYERYHK